MKYIFTLFTLALFSTSFGQYKLQSIDYNTPYYNGGSYDSLFALGVTLQKDSSRYQLFGRITGYQYGGFIDREFLDTASHNFDYRDRAVYKLPEGDSVLTHDYVNYNAGIGIQVGLREDFTLWTIPLYYSAHIGLYAQRFHYGLGMYYTTNTPDTTFQTPEYFNISEYTLGQTFNSYEDEGWSIIPQVGLETGIVLSAGKRLQVIPKLTCNASCVRESGIQTNYDKPLAAEIKPNYSLDLSLGTALQISYLLNRD